MRCSRLLIAMVCHVGVFVCVQGHADLIGESAAQDLPRDSPSKSSEELQSKKPGKVVPLAGFEERLRQSPRWQTMTPEEQEQALEKVSVARKQILERQHQLQTQYEDQIKKMEKPRETLMSKRRKREQYQDADTLWSRYQALPIEKRLTLERELGLEEVLPQHLELKFQERLDKLLPSQRNKILRELK